MSGERRLADDAAIRLMEAHDALQKDAALVAPCLASDAQGAMAEIINLRMARKAKRRDDAAREAAENRARHGEARGEKLRRRQEVERLARSIDGARREDDAGR